MWLQKVVSGDGEKVIILNLTLFILVTIWLFMTDSKQINKSLRDCFVKDIPKHEPLISGISSLGQTFSRCWYLSTAKLRISILRRMIVDGSKIRRTTWYGKFPIFSSVCFMYLDLFAGFLNHSAISIGCATNSDIHMIFQLSTVAIGAFQSWILLNSFTFNSRGMSRYHIVHASFSGEPFKRSLQKIVWVKDKS